MLLKIVLKPVVLIPVVAVLLVSITYGIFILKRNFNYSLGYESKVVETVCDMVSHDALKDPRACK